MKSDKDKEILRELYTTRFGEQPDVITRMSGAGGDRIYYRMSSPAAGCIGTVGDSEADCRAFLALDSAFRRHDIPVPEVYAAADNGMFYLQQDLGDVSLLSLRDAAEWEEMQEQTVRTLVRLHTLARGEWIDAVEYGDFSRRQAMWDLNYFKYEYLKPQRIPFDEDRLQDDFESLADMLTGAGSGPRGFMMRDCQSRNVMIYKDSPWLIDFQGGRCGPVVYDLVSLLWQAKARISPSRRQELIDLYAAEYKEATGTDISVIEEAVPLMALFRTLQVLGAYGFRGIVEHRAHFIESIQPALDNLSDLMDCEVLTNLPELAKVCRYAVEHSPVPASHQGLLLKVFSFSYKRGYPADMTGNGGGFMFDCRGMHNPGRYDEYKPLTGLDRPVIEFLESRGEVQEFVGNAIRLVQPALDCYIRRGFSDLQVGFGCTGGRHRSVYCAEHFARAVKSRYPDITVNIIHREQGIDKVL